MMILMLIAGFGCLLAGVLAIGFGIPVKEFSFGNTLILAGVVGACTGLLMMGMGLVVRELKNIAGRLGGGADWAGTASQPRATPSEAGSFQFGHDQPADVAGAGAPATAPSSVPWLEGAAGKDRARNEAAATPEPAEAGGPPKPRRNLMFSSISRKERERAQVRAAEEAADSRPASDPAANSEASEVPPAGFEDAWPKSEGSRSADAAPRRRAGRAPSTFSEEDTGATGTDRNQPGAGKDAQPPVTVLKSGVVDGMAYSLYSDGSIEAQMPEGMMRFASIDELRAHLDQRS